MENMEPNHDVSTPVRLLVRVLQDVVRRETFTTYGDLVEAFKCRCAQLHIRYDAGLISEALDRLELGGQARLIALPVTRRLEERPPEPEVFSKAEAATLAARLQIAVRPIAKVFDQEKHDQHNKAVVAEVYREARKPRPLAERLAEIFEEQP